MNELQQTQRFQRLIRPDMTQKELIKLYKNLIAEEAKEVADAHDAGNMLKECGDLIVVATGLINALNADVSEVLERVNVSNMSKMCLSETECIDTERAFMNMGIKTYTLHLEDCYGVYSASKQKDINGKEYASNKLLKAINYAPVNEGDLAKLAEVDL